MDKEDILQLIEAAKEAKVKHLDLSNKDINELPDEIGSITSLTSLNLSYNEIEELPDSICKLSGLQELFLLRNRIKKLPHGISALSKLKTLDISFNPISGLPADFGYFKSLEYFDASFCKIRRLPIDFSNLISLKHLILDDNPMEFPPLKVINRGLYAIMHFLIIERKKTEASRVALHVINMPEKVQSAFEKYIDYFGQMLSKSSSKDVIFDMSFLNQDFYQNMGFESIAEDDIIDWINSIRTGQLNESKINSSGNLKSFQASSKLMRIKTKLSDLNKSLDKKVAEINDLRSEITKLNDLIDETP